MHANIVGSPPGKRKLDRVNLAQSLVSNCAIVLFGRVSFGCDARDAGIRSEVRRIPCECAA